jgi:uncharacterized membrane protein
VLIGATRTHRGALATAARLVGGALVAGVLGPSLSNGVVRAGAHRRRVRLRTTLVVQLPVRDAFAFCRDFENFPRVVLALERVIDYQDGRSHWEVRSPRGELLAWDAVVTKYVPNVVIAWDSVPGSVVDCRGLIRFSPIDAESSRLDVEVQYDPCHTGFKDAIRAFADTSREKQLEADLARAKRYLTTQPAVESPELEPEAAAT